MERERFEQIIRDALSKMPEFLREKLKNIDIIIEDEPIEQKSLLGLYQGVPLKRRGFWYGNVMPDRIVLFKKNIEQVSRSDDDVEHMIYRVVIHEIGHYFGFDEETLRKHGY